MKNKILSFIVALCLIIPCAVMFTGCKDDGFKGDVWDGENTCLYAAVPYWYQQAGTDDAYPPVQREDLLLGD